MCEQGKTVQAEHSSRQGLWAALLAYVLWGVLPVFWKSLASVDSLEVLCHRVFWSFVFLSPLMFFKGRLGSLRVFLQRPVNLLALAASGFLLVGNWYLYIWAIASDMVVEASLGYYITPLVNIIFGVVVFRERMSRLVALAIGLAVVGVLWQVFKLGHFPVVPLGLAFSFGIYGLLRKILKVQAIPGLFVETLVVLPLAAGYLAYQASLGNSAFFRGDPVIEALLVGAGIITTVPLICFAYGAQRIRMTSLGVLQYVNPTIVFLLGVFVYGESFTFDSLVTFGCIWAALALYTWVNIGRRSPGA
ncbi:EamA family transporter RarD [Desulfovibrio sp. OttesenSCG-928-F20]|nr:EamA family transporter RarD [Desulfovibrio sp. OttesenSCG-928-F20]